MGPGGLNEDLRGLMGVQVEQAGEWGGIQHLLPSQNGWVCMSNMVEQGSRGVVQGTSTLQSPTYSNQNPIRPLGILGIPTNF